MSLISTAMLLAADEQTADDDLAVMARRHAQNLEVLRREQRW